MEIIENKLYEASLQGDVSTLKTLIQEDPLILDRSVLTLIHDTPLHVSILRGHVEFALEVVRLNPGLATVVDSLGQSPLHLAAAKGHVEIVRELIRVGINTCLARSKNGLMPLHLAIVKGVRVEVVRELIQACPESTRARVDRGDTALHLSVKYNNIDALQVLVDELMGENDVSILLNVRNDDGNTILHLAALHKYLQVIRYLVAKPEIELNAINNNGLTALDLIENSPRDIKALEILNFLLQSNAQRANYNSNSLLRNKNLATFNSPGKTNNAIAKSKSWKRFFTFSDNNHLEKLRGQMFITAAIIAAVNALPIINMNVNGPDITILDGYSTYSLSFVPAVSIMVLLVSGFSLRNKLCVWLVLQLMYTTLGFFGLNFIGAMISNENRYFDTTTFVVMVIWFGLLLMLSLLNLIRLIVWIVTSIKGCRKRRNLRAQSENPLSNA